MTKGKDMLRIPVDVAHDLYHLLERFKYARHCPCMNRDKAECHKQADKIQDYMEKMLAEAKV